MSPKPEASEDSLNEEQRAQMAAAQQEIDDAERDAPEAEAAAAAERENSGLDAPQGAVAGLTNGDDPEAANDGKPSKAAFEEFQRNEEARKASGARNQYEPDPEDESLKAKLYRGTIPPNGKPGLLTQKDEDEQLENVDVSGSPNNRNVNVRFRNGMQVHMNGSFKEATGLQSQGDRARAASMMLDQAEREGWSKVRIHGDDEELKKQLYYGAKARGMSTSGYAPHELKNLFKKKPVIEPRVGSPFGDAPQQKQDAGATSDAPEGPDGDDKEWIKVRRDDPRLTGLAGDMAKSHAPDVAAAAAFAERMEKLMERAGRSVNGSGNVAATGDYANAVNGNGNVVGTGNVVINGPVTVNVDGRSIGGASDLRGMMDQFGDRGPKDKGPGPVDITPAGGDDVAASAVERLHSVRHKRIASEPTVLAGYIGGPGAPQLPGGEKRALLNGPTTDDSRALPGVERPKALPAPKDSGAASADGEIKALPAPPKALPAPPKALPPPKGM